MAMEITMDNFEQEVLNSDIPVLIDLSLQGRKNRRRQISQPCRSVRGNEHPYRYGI